MTTRKTKTMPDAPYSSYWRLPEADPESKLEWQRRFETTPDKAGLFKNVLDQLPSNLGTVKFFELHPGQRFVLCVTYDEESDGARQNAAAIFSALIDSGWIKIFGTEGAWGRVAHEWLRVFPDKEILRSVADEEFKKFNFTPLEYAAMLGGEWAKIYGIEDPDLYKQTVELYKEGSPEYWRAIERRASVMFESLLKKMDELELTEICASVTSYNFSAGHRWLSGQRVAHAGIEATPTGKSPFYRLGPALRREIVDPNVKAMEEIMGGGEGAGDEEEPKKRRFPWFRRT
jgi:hypothetical protein